MERGSDKHGSRLDEEMKEETQGIERGAPVDPRVEPHRTMEEIDDGDQPNTEGPGEGQEGDREEPSEGP
jgi:hypothetical protein